MRVNAEIAVTYRAFPYKENTANHRGELYLCTLLLLENRAAAGTAVTSRFGNSCSTREPRTYQRVLQGREEAERAGARRREEAGGLSASSTSNRAEPGSSQRCPVAEQVTGTGETQEDPLKHKRRSLSCGLVRLRDKSRRRWCSLHAQEISTCDSTGTACGSCPALSSETSWSAELPAAPAAPQLWRNGTHTCSVWKAGWWAQQILLKEAAICVSSPRYAPSSDGLVLGNEDEVEFL